MGGEGRLKGFNFDGSSGNKPTKGAEPAEGHFSREHLIPRRQLCKS